MHKTPEKAKGVGGQGTPNRKGRRSHHSSNKEPKDSLSTDSSSSKVTPSPLNSPAGKQSTDSDTARTVPLPVPNTKGLSQTVLVNGGHSPEVLGPLRATCYLHYGMDDLSQQLEGPSANNLRRRKHPVEYSILSYAVHDQVRILRLALPAGHAKHRQKPLGSQTSTNEMEPVTLSSEVSTLNHHGKGGGSGRRSHSNRQFNLWTSTFLFPGAAQVLAVHDIIQMIPQKCKLTACVYESWHLSSPHSQPGESWSLVTLCCEDANCLGNAIRMMQNAICSQLGPERMLDERLQHVRDRIIKLLAEQPDNSIKMTHLRTKYADLYHTQLISVQYGRRGPSGLVKLLGNAFEIVDAQDDKIIKLDKDGSVQPLREELLDSEHTAKLTLHRIMYMQHFPPSRVSSLKSMLEDAVKTLYSRRTGADREPPKLDIDMEFTQCLAAIDKTNLLDEYFRRVNHGWGTESEKHRTPIGWLDDVARNLLTEKFSVAPRNNNKVITPAGSSNHSLSSSTGTANSSFRSSTSELMEQAGGTLLVDDQPPLPHTGSTSSVMSRDGSSPLTAESRKTVQSSRGSDVSLVERAAEDYDDGSHYYQQQQQLFFHPPPSVGQQTATRLSSFTYGQSQAATRRQQQQQAAEDFSGGGVLNLQHGQRDLRFDQLPSPRATGQQLSSARSLSSMPVEEEVAASGSTTGGRGQLPSLGSVPSLLGFTNTNSSFLLIPCDHQQQRQQYDGSPPNKAPLVSFNSMPLIPSEAAAAPVPSMAQPSQFLFQQQPQHQPEMTALEPWESVGNDDLFEFDQEECAMPVDIDRLLDEW